MTASLSQGRTRRRDPHGLHPSQLRAWGEASCGGEIRRFDCAYHDRRNAGLAEISYRVRGRRGSGGGLDLFDRRSSPLAEPGVAFHTPFDLITILIDPEEMRVELPELRPPRRAASASGSPWHRGASREACAAIGRLDYRSSARVPALRRSEVRIPPVHQVVRLSDRRFPPPTNSRQFPKRPGRHGTRTRSACSCSERDASVAKRFGVGGASSLNALTMTFSGLGRGTRLGSIR
jgi:hypothetical protein